ncbi:MAG: hypothetical protein PHH77_01880 [Victivallaceae bacterium]|nr:hypothetical protein [Victivallaceae bacterium]
MKNILFAVGIVGVGILFGGCVNSGPAPQNVQLKSPDGKAVIIKDIYDLPPVSVDKLGNTEIVKVFFPGTDNVKFDCSLMVLKILPGTRQARYKQTGSQILYTLSGGGNLQIDNNMIALKKGIMVYVPANAVMSITNNLSRNLELGVITSPPFASSQMTILEERSSKVKVSKDLEDEMNEEGVPVQTVSEQYKPRQEIKRSLSVEEYRDKLSKELAAPVREKDSLLDIPETAVPAKKSELTWPLKMPDSSKTPLETLEIEQENKLLPRTPQKAENVDVKNIQTLTPKEQAVPISADDNKPSDAGNKKIDVEQTAVEKLLKDSKKQEDQLLAKDKKTLKVKKTSLKHVQELSPVENAVQTKSDKASTK